MASYQEWAKDHRLLLIGTLAGGAVAVVTIIRKPAAPVITVTPPASSGGGASSADLLSAVSTGAQAASSGFDYGAQLGSAGIGAASQAESDVASVAATLASSQAGLAGAIASELAYLQQQGGSGSGTNPSPAPSTHYATAVGVRYSGIAQVSNGTRVGGPTSPTVRVPTGTTFIVTAGVVDGAPWWLIASGQYTGYGFNKIDPLWKVS